MEDVAEAEAAVIEREVAVEATRRAAAEDAAAAKAASEQLAAERSAAEEADSGARRSESGPAFCGAMPLHFHLAGTMSAQLFMLASVFRRT